MKEYKRFAQKKRSAVQSALYRLASEIEKTFIYSHKDNLNPFEDWEENSYRSEYEKYSSKQDAYLEIIKLIRSKAKTIKIYSKEK